MIDHKVKTCVPGVVPGMQRKEGKEAQWAKAKFARDDCPFCDINLLSCRVEITVTCCCTHTTSLLRVVFSFQLSSSFSFLFDRIC